jgi:hypothetical protein
MDYNLPPQFLQIFHVYKIPFLCYYAIKQNGEISMIRRFQFFVSGITTCYRYMQRIKSFKMTEYGLSGTHAMVLFYLYHQPDSVPATALSRLRSED